MILCTLRWLFLFFLFVPVVIVMFATWVNVVGEMLMLV